MYDIQKEFQKLIRMVKVGYCAGIIDGEGCLYIGYNEKSQSTVMQIIVGMADRRPLAFLQETFESTSAGKIGVLNKQGKLHYRWVLCSENAYIALKEMLPFLQAKKEQAEIFLTFYEVWEKNKCERRRDWSILKLLMERLHELKRVPFHAEEYFSPATTECENSLETEGCDSLDSSGNEPGESAEMTDLLN